MLDPALITSILYLPAITHISGIPIAYNSIKCRNPTPPRCLSLVSLKLHESEIDEATLGLLLRTTPSLRHLHFDRHIDLDANPPPAHLEEWEWFDLPKLRRAIAPLQTQLRSPSLGVHFFANTSLDVGADSRWGVHPSICGFTEFTQLESLEVPLVVFPGQRDDGGGERVEDLGGLPRSLKRLRLRNDLAEHDTYLWEPKVALRWIEGFLGQKDEYAPQLEEMALVVGENRDHEWNEEERGQFRRLCAEVGIRCNISEDLSRF